MADTYIANWTLISGEITNSDPDNALRAGSKWDLYNITGVNAGDTVSLYMASGTLSDPYLQVTDSNGNIIVQDDDGYYNVSSHGYDYTGAYSGSGLDAFVSFV